MFRIGTCLAVLILLACAAGAQLHTPSGSADYDVSTAAIFHENDLLTIQVNMSSTDLSNMLAYPRNEVEYACTIQVSNRLLTETVKDVRIKIRGNTSRDALKKSFRLAFNSVVKGTRFHGVKKLNIIGDQNDVSIVRAKLVLDSLKAFGVPAQRAVATHFRINDGSRVNDIYVCEEPVDDLFLLAWFGSDTGNLYKCSYINVRADLRYISPGYASTYQNLGNGETYVEDNNEESPNFQDLADFIYFVNKSTDANFAAHLADYFNVEGFLRQIAADVVVGQWDNIWFGSNNYLLYHNPQSNRFEFMPYDYDNTLGIDFFGVDWAKRPVKDWGKGGFGSNPDISPLPRRVLAVPAWERQLRRYIREYIGAPNQAPDGTDYSDTTGDAFCASTYPQLDILSAKATNDAGFVYITLQLAGPVGVGATGTDYTQFFLFFDTKAGGLSSNPWGRAVQASAAADSCLAAWSNAGGGFQFYQDSGGGTWLQRYLSSGVTAGIDVDLTAGQRGVIRFAVPLAVLGVQPGQSFSFDAVTMLNRVSGIVTGVDYLSNPAVATPNFDTASTGGPFVPYTVQAAPGTAPSAAFSYATMAPKADQLKAMSTPYAYRGPMSGSTMDFSWTAADFASCFDNPTSYKNPGRPWNWGVKPYISARVSYLVGAVAAPTPPPNVTINEVLSSNVSILRDETGRYGDWIELYNGSNDAINLGGMYLTNNPCLPRKWRIPDGTSIAPLGFLIVWADEQTAHGPLHAGFTIAASGQTIALYDTDANTNILVDSLMCPQTGSDVSYGRYPDGSTTTAAFTTVTPGAPNDTTPRTITWPPVPPIYINEFMASNTRTVKDNQGEYEDWIELYNAGIEAVDLSGRFLTDSLSNPTKYVIPEGVVIPSGGRLLFWTDDTPIQGPTHLPFKLDASGEQIGLFERESAGLQPIDTLTFGAQANDVSMGRPCDGEPGLMVQTRPTPGTANASGSCSVRCPFFTENPLGGTVSVGRRVTMTFGATGTVPMSIRWRKDEVELTDGGTISGTRTPHLVISSASTADSGRYDVVLTNTCGSMTSNAASVLVRSYFVSDALDALAVAAGLQSGEMVDVGMLDADQDGSIGLTDALLILQQAG